MGKNLNIRGFQKALGKEYGIMVIDLERCLYRDFNNGFNVEISGIGRANRKTPLTLYLWYGNQSGSCILIKTVSNVERTPESIAAATDSLKEYADGLFAHGYDTRDKLWNLKYPETVREAQNS